MKRVDNTMRLNKNQLEDITTKIDKFVEYHYDIIGHCAMTGLTKGTEDKLAALIIMAPNDTFIALDFDEKLVKKALVHDFNQIVRVELIKKLELFNIEDTLEKYKEKQLMGDEEESVVLDLLNSDKRFFLDRADALKDFI